MSSTPTLGIGGEAARSEPKQGGAEGLRRISARGISRGAALREAGGRRDLPCECPRLGRESRGLFSTSLRISLPRSKMIERWLIKERPSRRLSSVAGPSRGFPVAGMQGDIMLGAEAGLQGQSMAPFLTKLFQIVSNLATDQAIV